MEVCETSHTCISGLTHPHNAVPGGPSVGGSHPFVVGVERDAVAPLGGHVKPLGMPYVGFQPDILPGPSAVFLQQISWSSPVAAGGSFGVRWGS